MAISWLTPDFALQSFEPAYPEPAEALAPLSRASQILPPSYREVRVVADIMARAPVTTAEEMSLSDALKTMSERGFRHLPVVRKGRLVGILSDRDVLRMVPRGELHALTVGAAMTRKLFTALAGLPICQAAELMAEHQIGCLPVVSSTGELEGLVTVTDIVHSLAFHAPIEAWL